MSDQNQDYRVQIESILLAVANKMEERMSVYEQRLEQIEKQIATLVVGFGEQAVFVEALLSQIAFADEGGRKAFQDSLQESRKQMLNIMKEGADDLLGSTDSNIAPSVKSVAEQKLSN